MDDADVGGVGGVKSREKVVEEREVVVRHVESYVACVEKVKVLAFLLLALRLSQLLRQQVFGRHLGHGSHRVGGAVGNHVAQTWEFECDIAYLHAFAWKEYTHHRKKGYHRKDENDCLIGSHSVFYCRHIHKSNKILSNLKNYNN